MQVADSVLVRNGLDSYVINALIHHGKKQYVRCFWNEMHD